MLESVSSRPTLRANTVSVKKPSRPTRKEIDNDHSRLSFHRDKERLKKVQEISAAAMLDIPKLAIDYAVAHIKIPPNDWGHKQANTPRVFSDLGASIFSMIFKPPVDPKQTGATPEPQEYFLSMIEEIERYMHNLVNLPNSSQIHEDMRKHKKFIEESMDDLEFLEQYFGTLSLPSSAIINFKKLRPVTLQIDSSADSY